MKHARLVPVAHLLALALALTACGAGEYIAAAPSPSETGFDPTFTESPTPVPSGVPPADLGDRDNVLVVVTYSTWSPATNEIQAFAFVPGVIEDQGQCTITAQRDAATVQATLPAIADASSTTCGELAIEDPQLTSGTWFVSVSYSSSASAGSSAEQELEIP